MAKKTLDARTSLFGRMAMETGLVIYEDIVECIEEQERVRNEGGTPLKLGELLIEKGILNKDQVEMILKQQVNPSNLMGRQLIESKLVTREQLKECLDEQIEVQRLGQNPPRLGELLVQKGYVTDAQIRSLLHKKDAPSSFLGEFLVANKLVSQADIDKCLAIQKKATEAGGQPKRLGDILVEQGILRPEEIEMYSQRYIQGQRARVVGTRVIKRSKANASVSKGDFQILKVLGQHYDGITYQSLHTPSSATVVTHFFNDTEIGMNGLDEDQAKAFEEKCNLAQEFKHNASQNVFSYERIQEKRVLVAEYINGMTLDELITEKGHVEWEWVMEIAIDLASALKEAADIGLIHDDIRPGSVFIDAAGKARIGLWAYTEDPIANRNLLAQRHKYLSFYNAPERRDQKASVVADIFSLGATVIHALTGTAVMPGASFEEAVENINANSALQTMAMDLTLPMGLLPIVGRMLDVDQEKRFESYHALLAALNELKEELGLEFSQGRAATMLTRSMPPEQAAVAINSFLHEEEAVHIRQKVSFRKLLGYYVLPICLMIAIAVITTIVYRTTQSSQGLMVRANWRDLNGDKAGALKLYSMISEIYPTNAEVQRRYYDLAMEMRNRTEAEVANERLMDLYPDNREYYLERQADLQVWQDRFLSAVELYREVARSRPTDNALKEKIAKALLWGRKWDDAKREFTALLEIDPSNPGYMQGVAGAAAGEARQIRSELALQSLSNGMTSSEREEKLRQLHENQDLATQYYDQLSRRANLPEDVLMEFAWTLFDSGETDRLQNLTQSVIRTANINNFKPTNQVYLYYWSGDYKTANTILGNLTREYPNSKEYLTLRININDQLGDYDSVINDYLTLSRLDPTNRDLLVTVGKLYQRKAGDREKTRGQGETGAGRSDFAKADEYFRLALSQDETNASVQLLIAENLGYMREHSDAIIWYNRVLEHDPNNIRALKGIVQSMIWNDRFQDALVYAERLYQDDPRDRWNRTNLATIYSRIGRGDLAEPIVKDLLDENLLTEEERDILATSALNAEDNRLLLRLIGADSGDSDKMREYSLILARRFAGQGNPVAALGLYINILGSLENPDKDLLLEAAEVATWAQNPGLATKFLDQARLIIAAQSGDTFVVDRTSGPLIPGQEPPKAKSQEFRLSPKEWDDLLKPLQNNPDVYDVISGFRTKLSQVDAPAKPVTPKS
jgi:Protein kinase domain.